MIEKHKVDVLLRAVTAVRVSDFSISNVSIFRGSDTQLLLELLTNGGNFLELVSLLYKFFVIVRCECQPGFLL